MEFQSILDLKPSPYRGGDRPTYLLDLNLDQVIDRIALSWGSDVSGYYEYFPADFACEQYRREVFGDIRQKEVFDLLCEFVQEMKVRQELQTRKMSVRSGLQKAVLHLMEVHAYGLALEHLCEKLKTTGHLKSEGMRCFLQYLEAYLSGSGFMTMMEQVKPLFAELTSFRICLEYEDDYILVREGETTGQYRTFLESAFQTDMGDLNSPFASCLSLTGLETEIMEVFQKKHMSFFRQTERFYREQETYTDERLLTFCSEISYYLSFYSFEQMMEQAGYVFAVPKIVGQQEEMHAQGMYDLALACALLSQKKPVIANSMSYRGQEQFFVLTGPNQGGKTTFARSLGQLIYFTKMGLDVPAQNASVRYFTDILTHFSVEESIETGRGKLKEELSRLAPMMREKFRNAFVIINELFTTAANYDACIMGQRVLTHFILQECCGIYVTHLKELTQAHERVVSLRAMVDADHRQNFHIERSQAEDIACAIRQVEKYHLRYEQLKERLS